MSEVYGSIRVDNGVRKIGVNDNGDYIELSVNDSGLYNRFADLLMWFDKQQNTLLEKEKEFKTKHGSAPIINKDEEGEMSVNIPAVVDITKINTERYQECCKKIDEVFGIDTCKKVFGDITPDASLITDFFEQMTPILGKLSDERMEKISNRYNRRMLEKKKKKRQRSKTELIKNYQGE